MTAEPMLEEKYVLYTVQVNTKTREVYRMFATNPDNLIVEIVDVFLVVQSNEMGEAISIPLDNVEIVTHFSQRVIGFKEQ